MRSKTLQIAFDFETLYPTKTNSLFVKFPLHKGNIFLLAEEKLKCSRERTVTDVLRSYLQCSKGAYQTKGTTLRFIIKEKIN